MSKTPAEGAKRTAALDAVMNDDAGRGVAPRDTARMLMGASISKNTKIAYRRALEKFDAWCVDTGVVESDDAAAAYLVDEFNAGAAPSSVSLVIAALRFRRGLQGLPRSPGPRTDRIAAGFRREGRGRGRGQVTGITWEDADRMAARAARDGDARGLRDAAIIAVMSDAMLRVSEMLALSWHHFRVADDRASGLVDVERSKTDQDGAGAVLYLRPSTMQRVAAWQVASGQSGGPVCLGVGRDGLIRLRVICAVSVRNLLKDRAASIGLTGRISSHSLRVGAAQSLAARGASLVEMQVAGRWQGSTMPAHYARRITPLKGAVAKLRP